MPLADRFDGYLIDLDGVVWIGDEPLPGAIKTLQSLDCAGARMMFLTNDPRSSRADYADRLTRLGYPAREAQIVTSAWAVAAYLAEHDAAGSSVFAIGSPALHAELASEDLRLLKGEEARHADIVVVGGHEDFDYYELRLATQAISRGAALYATNRDATFPMPDGPWPATGAILAAVEAAAGRRAVAVGKPEPFMFDVALAHMPDCSHVAVVGDRPEADVLGGNRAGLATILIDDRPNASHGDADHCLASLAALLDDV